MASRGRGARLKGAAFERLLAKLLTKKTGLQFYRGLGQTRGGGKEVSDVQCDLLPWLHIEAKNQKRCSIKAALRQAIADAKGKKQRPVAVTKDDHSDILVTMRLEDFLFFLKAVIKKRR